jgi:steroid delta-isomerase-like uncharacterized protein
MADHRAIAQRWFTEVVTEGNLDAADEICGPDFVDHDPLPGTGADLDGLKEGITQIRAAFPDIQAEADDILVEGDRVAVRSTMRATHEGDFLGIPASGKRIEVANYDFVRMDGDKCVEHWGVIDSAALMEQIGAVPAAS